MAQNGNKGNGEEGTGEAPAMLTGQRLQLAEALASGATVKGAAERLGVARRTAYRWSKEPAVKQFVAEAQREYMDAALRGLSRSVGPAVGALARHLAPNVTPSLQIRAAVAIVDATLKWKQAVDLEDRLAALEEALAARSQSAVGSTNGNGSGYSSWNGHNLLMARED